MNFEVAAFVCQRFDLCNRFPPFRDTPASDEDPRIRVEQPEIGAVARVDLSQLRIVRQVRECPFARRQTFLEAASENSTEAEERALCDLQTLIVGLFGEPDPLFGIAAILVRQTFDETQEASVDAVQCGLRRDVVGSARELQPFLENFRYLFLRCPEPPA